LKEQRDPRFPLLRRPGSMLRKTKQRLSVQRAQISITIPDARERIDGLIVLYENVLHTSDFPGAENLPPWKNPFPDIGHPSG
jgi:hypothetical protein